MQNRGAVAGTAYSGFPAAEICYAQFAWQIALPSAMGW
jgi:hypothetical protein